MTIPTATWFALNDHSIYVGRVGHHVINRDLDKYVGLESYINKSIYRDSNVRYVDGFSSQVNENCVS